VLKLIQDADLVVTSDTTSGIAEAEKLSKPWISVTLQPARIPVPNPNPSFVDRVIWPVFGQLMTAPTNRFRKRVGAPPVADMSSIMSKRMILLPVSRYVAPLDLRWPKSVVSTGYWFARESQDWRPPRDLTEFLGAGEKPIAISLGVMSIAGKQARQGAQIILESIQKTGVRAIIQGWDEVLSGVDLPETVYHAGSLPHGWLFPQVRAVIHHGGFGTTAAVLRAGAPGIIVPHIIDQFYWGQRVQELGVGPKFIPRNRLNVENMCAAITEALHNSQMQTRAARLGEKIRSEPDGVAAAVENIAKLVEGGGV
jgi:sterol 3beta-glucosyltransferase